MLINFSIERFETHIKICHSMHLLDITDITKTFPCSCSLSNSLETRNWSWYFFNGFDDARDFWYSYTRANYVNLRMCKSVVRSRSKILNRVSPSNIGWMSGRSLENSRQRALPLWVYCESTPRSRTHWLHYCQLGLEDLHREHKSFVRERFPWCFWYPRQIYQFRMMAFGNQERGSPSLSACCRSHYTLHKSLIYSVAAVGV